MRCENLKVVENGEKGSDEGLVGGKGNTQRRGTEAKCGTGATKEMIS